MKLILTESQFEYILSASINEQDEVGAGTDARTVSHNYLSTEYGLPEGASHENYLYTASVDDLINKIGSFEEKKKLSIFTPYKPYGGKGDYLDYFSLNGQELTPAKNEVAIKTFNLTPGGKIIASHNGLLSLTRAMDKLTNAKSKLRIEFGKETDVQKGAIERFSSYIKYDSNRALNQTSGVEYILLLFTIASINRNNYTLGFVKSHQNEMSKDMNTLRNIAQNYTNRLIQGYLGFIPVDMKNEKSIQFYEGEIAKLKSSGYIYTIDINEIFNKMVSLQNVYDYLNNTQNTDKKNILKQVSNEIIPSFVANLKSAYINNFKIFTNVYLDKIKDKILPDIESARFDYKPFTYYHEQVFTKTFYGGSVDRRTTLDAGQSLYKK